MNPQSELFGNVGGKLVPIDCARINKESAGRIGRCPRRISQTIQKK